MVLTVKVTAMALLLEAPPVTVILAVRVPADCPVGSAVMLTAAGVVPTMPKSCPFTLSQGEFGYESVKLMGAPVLLVTFTVWGATEAAEPPTWVPVAFNHQSKAFGGGKGRCGLLAHNAAPFRSKYASRCALTFRSASSYEVPATLPTPFTWYILTSPLIASGGFTKVFVKAFGLSSFVVGLTGLPEYKCR